MMLFWELSGRFARRRSAALLLVGAAVVVLALTLAPAAPALRADAVPCDSAALAFASNRDGDYDIYYMPNVCDPGSISQITFNNASDYTPSLSPDGRTIVFSSNLAGDWDIFAVDTNGDNLINLTADSAADDLFPDWSPDGTQIAFTTNRDANWDVYVMNANGSHLRRLTTDDFFEGNPSWSPDGTQIAYVKGRDDNRDIWVMDAAGTNQHAVVATRWAQYSPAWSPDGRTIAYVSNKIDPNLPLSASGTYYPHIHLTDPACFADDDTWLRCGRPLPSATVDTELDPAWLPDNRLVFGSVVTDNTDLYLVNVDDPPGTVATQLTTNPADDRFPS